MAWGFPVRGRSKMFNESVPVCTFMSFSGLVTVAEVGQQAGPWSALHANVLLTCM